ncbi:MAG: glycine cleavage system protein H [Syntrophobacteraceae bacterium]
MKARDDSFKMVPGADDKCIWMEAGVIDYKLCNNYYNCHTCGFDKAMKTAADRNAGTVRTEGDLPSGKKSIVTWREKMKRKSGLNRKCRHSLSGRAPFRLCPHDYECSSCAFDQMLEDGLELQLPFRVAQIPEIEGYGVPDGHFFHLGHSWARVENGGRIRIGIDDFSTRVFGQADKFDLPLTGEEVTISEVGMSFHRDRKEAAVLSPASGIVVAVNNKAARDPALVREEPYNDGWLMVLEPVAIKKNLKELMFGSQAADWIEGEHYKLMQMVSQIGVTMADGGTIHDVAGSIPSLDWTILTNEFLKT